jgi:hypothetical protein
MQTEEIRMKPWKGNRDGAVLAAFLGCWGCKTGEVESLEELTFIAARVYELPDELSPGDVGRRIDALGKKERKRLAYKNIPAMFPEPDAIWPAGIPPRAGAGGLLDARPTAERLQRMMDDSAPQMIDGAPFGVDGQLDIDPAKLLRKVVSAVINAGHASDLYEFPEVLAFFGARLPADPPPETNTPALGRGSSSAMTEGQPHFTMRSERV